MLKMIILYLYIITNCFRPCKAAHPVVRHDFTVGTDPDGKYNSHSSESKLQETLSETANKPETEMSADTKEEDSMHQPNPLIVCEPCEPVIASEPITACEPVIASEPIIACEPVIASEPITACEPVIAHEPRESCEPAAAGKRPAILIETKPEPADKPAVIKKAVKKRTATKLPACPAQKKDCGLLYYRKCWERRKVQLYVRGDTISGTPIFIEDGTLRVINDEYSYFIPLDKVDYIRTDDGLQSSFKPAMKSR